MAIGGESGSGSSSTTGTVKTGQQQDTQYDGTNTVTNSGSQNTTTNSGSQNVTTTDASQNTTVTGPSSTKTSSTTRTSDQVNTSQLLLSQDAVDHIVQGILEGTSGLAAISGGQKAAGAYNSSTQGLLVNDLLSRTAGEVAARSAVTKTVIGGTTSTTEGTIENSGNTVTQNIGATKSTTDIGGSTSTTDIGGSTSTTKATGTSAQDILTDTATQNNTSSQQSKVSVGWILCTELHRQGRMPSKYYIPGARVFASYEETTKRGYYIWAIPALKELKTNPFSLQSRILCKLLNSRAEYIAAECKVRGARKTILGFFCKQLRWGCWILGNTIARDFEIPDFSKEVNSNA